jgi:hypothetical protein
MFSKNGKSSVDAMFKQIKKMRAKDPLIGAKMGSQEIVQRIMTVLSKIDNNGVHIQSLVGIVGSLAGYACQASIRREYIEEKGLTEEDVFTIIEDTSNHRYFFGDALNNLLVENQFSVWSIAAGYANSVDGTTLPDIKEIFEYVTSTVGTDKFGLPRLDERMHATPIEFVKTFWNSYLPDVERFCASPNEWPILYALAIQECMKKGHEAGIIDPRSSLTIAMECAVPMSKIDLPAYIH